MSMNKGKEETPSKDRIRGILYSTAKIQMRDAPYIDNTPKREKSLKKLDELKAKVDATAERDLNTPERHMLQGALEGIEETREQILQDQDAKIEVDDTSPRGLLNGI